MRILKPLSLMRLLTWSFSLYVNSSSPQRSPFAFAEITCAPCLGSHALCHCLALIPPGHPPHLPRLWHTFATIAGSLPTAEMPSSPHLSVNLPGWAAAAVVPLRGCLLHPAQAPVPCIWANPFPHVETLPCPLRLWCCAGMPSTSGFLSLSELWHPIPDCQYGHPQRVGASYLVQAAVALQVNTPTRMPSRGQSDPDLHGRLPFPWGAPQHLIGL